MIDFQDMSVSADRIFFYTDASKAETKGFGCIFGSKWTISPCQVNYTRDFDPSIAYLELYALCMGIFQWQGDLKNVRIIIFCDNQAVGQ